MLINEPGQDLCRIDIDIYDIYSPNLTDAEIIVNANLSKLYLMFEPTMMNDTLKFFRNTRSYIINDIEKLNVQLMDASEKLFETHHSNGS
jgi:hypothetical protein